MSAFENYQAGGLHGDHGASDLGPRSGARPTRSGPVPRSGTAPLPADTDAEYTSELTNIPSHKMIGARSRPQ